MTRLTVIGFSSVALVVLGVGLAGGFGHVAWRLGEVRRRRRARRRRGQVAPGSRQIQVQFVADASQLQRELRRARRELERLQRAPVRVVIHIDGRHVASALGDVQ